MNEFILKHASVVTGVLSGFDRVLFRGTFRNLIIGTGIQLFLSVNKVLFKDAEELQRICPHQPQLARHFA